jgi:hypothetical protein
MHTGVKGFIHIGFLAFGEYVSVIIAVMNIWSKFLLADLLCKPFALGMYVRINYKQRRYE